MNIRFARLDAKFVFSSRSGLSRTKWYGEGVSEMKNRFGAKSTSRVSSSATQQASAARGSLKIIGIAGTNGSGKDTVAAVLAEDYGYFVGSATDMLEDELKKRNLPTDRLQKRTL